LRRHFKLSTLSFNLGFLAQAREKATHVTLMRRQVPGFTMAPKVGTKPKLLIACLLVPEPAPLVPIVEADSPRFTPQHCGDSQALFPQRPTVSFKKRR
jgi:hypothetical protein